MTDYSDSIQIMIQLNWHSLVNDDIDLFNINTAREQISTNDDSVLSFLELIVNFESLGHRHCAITSTTWETLLGYDVVQILRSVLLASEHNNLIKLKVIK